MRGLFYGTISFVVLFIVFISLDYNGFGNIVSLFEWVTRFILPWIVVYWFIQFVKREKV